VSPREEHQDEPVGVRLRRLRVERGLSQRELSGPGVSYAYISRIEAGERRPSVKALRVLAPKLGVSTEYLETGKDITPDEERELRLADAELELRLADDSAAAVAKLEAVLEDARAAGDAGTATRARLALGLAAAQDDRHEEAVTRLEEALADSLVRPHSRADVFATLGRSYTAVDRHADAIALFQRCLDETARDAPDDDASYVRFATYLSYALTDTGDYARAEAVMREALSRARGSSDPYTRVRIYWSLARLTAAEGKSTDALDYMRRAIALLEATDDTLHLARAHLLSARIETSSGNPDASDEHLDVAEGLFGPSPEEIDLGQLRLERARAAVARGEGSRAEELARQALAAFGPHHAVDLGEAWLALANGLSLLDRDDEAETAYREAISLLEAHAHREVAAAHEGLGRLLVRTGRTSEGQEFLASAEARVAPQRNA
jgi:tetratricopeptide (TPR) repeat protein